MRHGKKNNHLSRTASHRKAMLANMASSLILHKRITTTLAKAKALRVYVEPIITKAKDDTTHSRRTVFSYLKNIKVKQQNGEIANVINILFREVAEKVASRPGGYTRILKMGNRLGDNASMALIELVDFNEVYKSGDAGVEKKSTRRRGSKAKKTTDAPVTATKAVKEDKEVETAKAITETKAEAQEEVIETEVNTQEETPAVDTPPATEGEEDTEVK